MAERNKVSEDRTQAIISFCIENYKNHDLYHHLYYENIFRDFLRLSNDGIKIKIHRCAFHS